ncbi:MAG: chitobiase/beta-hexosaminidase C-terminal domain-containing protein [Lachnospiraceae bacterium]|nr:chitobiase/beta-hexosaminidase C-terminal domain-containing protein [Lachnospiraceae bacterium]
MKCPKCNASLPEGKLFCEKCGEEINIVPEYDPDSEFKVNVAGVFDKTRELDTKEVKKRKYKSISDTSIKRKKSLLEEDDDYEDDDIETGSLKDIIYSAIDFWNKNTASKIIVIFLAAMVVIAFIAIGVLISTMVNKHNLDYYISSAEDCVAEKDYEGAIKFYEKAIAKSPDDIKIKYAVSECYLAAGQDNNAVFVLKEIATENPSFSNDAYEKMFNIYYENKDWKGINDLLLDCDNEQIVSKFNEYLCRAPEFSVKGGEYDEAQTLELSASPYGFVYYTTDGTDPDENSFLYTDPIFLESGEYEIKAVFISENNVKSEIADETYNIKVLIPLAPQVSIESGSYNVPILISVNSDINCKTYYVCYREYVKESDRVDPTMEEATEYESPIPMPMGASEFRFISYNEEGVPSTIITRKYNVKIENATVSKEQAANIATLYKYKLGGLQSTDGYSTTANGKFDYSIEDAINIRGTVYYIINEYYRANSNKNVATFTGLRYAVNINNPLDYGTLEVNPRGEYYVVKQATIDTEQQ